jgi:hypothetical protein
MNSTQQKKWRRIISNWQKSGLTKAEYCRRKKINLRIFSYHSIKNKAFSKPQKVAKIKSNPTPNSTSNPKSNPGPFAELICDESSSDLKQKPQSRALVLRLDCGASIELGTDFNPELLRQILKIAKDLS